MNYLDISKLSDILTTDYGEGAEERLAGVAHRTDSGYFGIVRFFGDEAVEPAAVPVSVSHDTYQCPDPIITKYARRIEAEMRAAGRLYDGPPSMKLSACDLKSACPRVQVQPVEYGLQAGTCFALDEPDDAFADFGGTLRSYWYATRPDRSVAHNPLAICLGVCGHLLVHEGEHSYLLQVKRAGQLASFESTVGPSIAGVVDFSDQHATLLDILSSALSTEVREEAGLDNDEFRMVPLAWAMEVFRGDRPQLFGLVETDLSRSEISNRLEGIPGREREHSSFEFVQVGDDTAALDGLFRVSNPEGRMSVLLLEEYLESNQA